MFLFFNNKQRVFNIFLYLLFFKFEKFLIAFDIFET